MSSLSPIPQKRGEELVSTTPVTSVSVTLLPCHALSVGRVYSGRGCSPTKESAPTDLLSVSTATVRSLHLKWR